MTHCTEMCHMYTMKTTYMYTYMYIVHCTCHGMFHWMHCTCVHVQLHVRNVIARRMHIVVKFYPPSLPPPSLPPSIPPLPPSPPSLPQNHPSQRGRRSKGDRKEGLQRSRDHHLQPARPAELQDSRVAQVQQSHAQRHGPENSVGESS